MHATAADGVLAASDPAVAWESLDALAGAWRERRPAELEVVLAAG